MRVKTAFLASESPVQRPRRTHQAWTPDGKPCQRDHSAHGRDPIPKGQVLHTDGVSVCPQGRATRRVPHAGWWQGSHMAFPTGSESFSPLLHERGLRCPSSQCGVSCTGHGGRVGPIGVLAAVKALGPGEAPQDTGLGGPASAVGHVHLTVSSAPPSRWGCYPPVPRRRGQEP